MDLKGKRLLILGGSNNAPDIKVFGEREGVTLVAAGNSFSEGIKNACDEFYTIDILDREAVKKLIIDEKIDGVFVGGNEDIISCAIDVTEALGLHFYTDRKIWDTVMNKSTFKESCIEYGVPTMETYDVDEDDLEKTAESLSYPVVIKPVDCCGSNGVMKCERKEDFADLYNNAKACSRTNSATVEEFVDGDEVVAYYTFVDGQVTLSSICDRYNRGNADSFIPLSEIFAYPSRHLNQFITEVDQNMRKMLLSFGIRNGITSMQSMYKDGKFRFFEMGYRLGGTAQYRYTEHINNVNSFHMMMAHSLTGKMQGSDMSKDTAVFKKPCCTFTLMSKGGTVASVEGIEEIKKLHEIICIENRYKPGDTIKVTRTTSQFHVRTYIVADTVERMKEVINIIQETVKAYDVNGESMLITHFDVDKLDFGDASFE